MNLFKKKNKEKAYPYPGKLLKVGTLPYGEAFILGKYLDTTYYGATITFWYGNSGDLWTNNPATTMKLSKVEVDSEYPSIIRVYSEELLLHVMKDEIVHVSFN